MAPEPSVASKSASDVRRRALGKARRAIRKAESQTKFTGEKPSVFLYGGAALIALLKDLLDFVGIGSLPAIGFIVTACFSILIFLLLTVFDNSGGWNKANRVIMRGLVFTLVVIFEGALFGLNFLPLETFTVIGLYIFAKRAWKKAEKEAEEKNKYMIPIDMSRRGQERAKRQNQEMKGSAENSRANMNRRKEEFDRKEEERKMRRAEEKERLANTMRQGEEERNKRESFYNRRTV